MDAFTHGLASYSVTRVAFPRASRWTVLPAILAGMTANLDQLSAYGGPSAFFEWYRAATHSVVGTLLIVVVFAVAVLLVSRQKPNADSFRTVVLALVSVCFLHLAMDLTQNESVQLLWPFRARRYSADWVAHFDLWILLILLAGVLLPQLLALVTEEIGAKSKAPRGRIGAIIALLAVMIYIGGRAILHGNGVAMMEARTYRGELLRRVAAFAESDSPFHWRGMVETERAFHELDLSLARGGVFQSGRGGRLLQAGIVRDAGRCAQHRFGSPLARHRKIPQSYRGENEYRLPRPSARSGRTTRRSLRSARDRDRPNRSEWQSIEQRARLGSKVVRGVRRSCLP